MDGKRHGEGVSACSLEALGKVIGYFLTSVQTELTILECHLEYMCLPHKL